MQQSIVLLASLAAAFSIIGTSAQAQNQAEIAAQQLQRQQQREKAQSEGRRILGAAGFKNDNISITVVGLAVTPAQLTDSAVKVIGKSNSNAVTSVYMANDPVSVVPSFNKGDILQALLEFNNVRAKQWL